MIRTNLRELVAHEAPPFHGNILTVWREWSDQLFFIEKGETVENDSVNLDQIIGHDQGYGKMSWEYMFSNLKRINRRREELEGNPDYYLRGRDYVAWSFLNLDGAYFISQGKHRTTIARYLAHYNPYYFPHNKISGVTVTHYSVNKSSMDVYEEVKRLLRHPTLDHLESGFRQSWSLSESYFFIRNPHRSVHDELRFNSDELESALNLLQKRSLGQKLFGSPETKYLLCRGIWR